MFATEAGPEGAVAGYVPLDVLARELVEGWAAQSAHLAGWLARWPSSTAVRGRARHAWSVDEASNEPWSRSPAPSW